MLPAAFYLSAKVLNLRLSLFPIEVCAIMKVQNIAQINCKYDCKYVSLLQKCKILPMNYQIIKERRSVLGLTQQDLSDYTGLSVRFIKSVEAGNGNPSVNNLEKIADVLGLEIVIKVKEVNV